MYRLKPHECLGFNRKFCINFWVNPHTDNVVDLFISEALRVASLKDLALQSLIIRCSLHFYTKAKSKEFE